MLLRIILIFFPVASLAQSQYRFEHFTIKNGLSQNTVNCILKDSEGYYWFGTQDGLNRYDGYSVKFFRHDRNNSATVSDNFILSLLEDHMGNLWVGTRNGLNHYDKRAEKFTRIIANENEKTFFHNSIYAIIQDQEGNIFFSNYYLQFVKISALDCTSPPFTPIEIGKDKRLYGTGTNSYCFLDSTSSQFILYNRDNHQGRCKIGNFQYGKTYSVLETKSGKLFIGGEGGIVVKSIKGADAKSDTLLPGKNITKFLEDRHQNIWVGTTSGLYIFEAGELDKQPVELKHVSEDAHSIGSNSVQGLYEDSEGLIWVGTSEAGMSIYDPQRSVLKIFNKHTSVPLSANSVWGIYQDGNELWVGTNFGLNHFVFENGSISGLYSHKNKVIRSEIFRHTGSYTNSICSNFITAITKGKNGELWFGSHDHGISVYNPGSKEWKHINTKNSPLRSDAIFHLMCASDGKIWISTMDGFFSYDPAADHFQSFLSTAYEKDGFPIGYIICTYEDADRTIWAGSTLGAYHIKSSGERIAIYNSKAGDGKSLSYNMVTSFLRDRKKRLWVGTLGAGLNLFDDPSKTFSSYQKSDGLANDVIYTILEDKKGKLWISTNMGISCFDPEKQNFTNYSEKDGIAANEFSQNAGFLNSSGELLFGSPEGLNIFHPEEITEKAHELPAIISSLKINYDAVNYSPGNPIDLYYGDKTITFEFTAPDFRNQEKIQYAFQLEGFDDKWHEVPASKRMASFTNLPFGSYIFKVLVKKGNEDWQQKLLSVPVNVIPPFWLKPWFIGLEIILGLALIVLLVKYYSQRKLKKQLQEAELQKKIHLEKERISRDLHDNVGSHLTYIITSLDNISFKMEKGEKNISTEKISALSDFSRTTMQQLRESIWAINKKTVPITELKDKISEYASRMASAGNMNFDIEFSLDDNSALKPSHAMNIYRIIQEAINNSIKHSEARSLLVVINKNGDKHISIEVKDNGKGMNARLNDQVGQENSNSDGYGLKNMQDRIKDMNGTITIDSGEKGTKIHFTIPI